MPARRQASGASHTPTRNAVRALAATSAAISAATAPVSMASASAPTATAVTAAYKRFGARSAAAESPNSEIAAPDIQ